MPRWSIPVRAAATAVGEAAAVKAASAAATPASSEASATVGTRAKRRASVDASPSHQPKHARQESDADGDTDQNPSPPSSNPLLQLGSLLHAPPYVTKPKMVDERRIRRILPTGADASAPPMPIPSGHDGVLYWMSRDQRVQDNWALIYAQQLAIQHRVPLFVGFCLVPHFLDATIRQYDFMMEGLREVETALRGLNISFHLFTGTAAEHLPGFVESKRLGAVVTDFSPVRVIQRWTTELANSLAQTTIATTGATQSHTGIPLIQLDAHNVVPCWHASPKLEYAARTIRPKLHKLLSEFLTEFPEVAAHPCSARQSPSSPQSARASSAASSNAHFQSGLSAPVDWDAARASLQVNRTITAVPDIVPGTRAGMTTLRTFVEQRMRYFGAVRNDPNERVLSNLSPYFHFGQIAPQRAILVAYAAHARCRESVDVFVEEALVRRELSDNFCFYNPNYDSIAGASAWAQETLQAHAGDAREFVYTEEELESATTHDLLWNAAQLEMVREGKMHGFMRMYWAKKILEWTASPSEALRIAIHLNDKYNLDGRDPNGYVGCMWSICGIHDQGWGERPIFGKIRFMNLKGCQRKFDVAKYTARFPSTPSSQQAAKRRGAAAGGIDRGSNYARATTTTSNRSTS
ncbi:deoxyribodipyrimidine photo-lyase [Capsaspora owczarzaki ATCC 30864]|uniref:Deoxyribodipyrimidine photo-lyase n=1 Tax=Capsaspora owczarzaki (strain ATCC 30864) TaxID=595528 RepID=A0A0D2WQ91_CAPO3|nr:deoxyribodipyrimidine photo-lyase [Capsaspora owczarzaki ATCC 30864]KJE93780.1 deoxyribodipyrimidine photo-lyase [Capsaspora owczarzaki ATCC 30864]|eukprot:XP_004347271.1 deoxyribodipyrimidine photo-lyase [Capsaspora owczarzaki ATCC 30864]